jgi:hypothetical protein
VCDRETQTLYDNSTLAEQVLFYCAQAEFYRKHLESLCAEYDLTMPKFQDIKTPLKDLTNNSTLPHTVKEASFSLVTNSHIVDLSENSTSSTVKFGRELEALKKQLDFCVNEERHIMK